MTPSDALIFLIFGAALSFIRGSFALLWGQAEDISGDGSAWWVDGVDIQKAGGEDQDFFSSEGNLHSRVPRTLVYPNAGVTKLIIGLGIPVPVPNKTVALGVNFQFQYPQVTNASVFLYPPVRNVKPKSDESARRYSRAAVYSAVEDVLERRGLDGRSCLHRAICEAAEAPMLHDGLFGELLHLFLTPSLGHAPPELLEEYRQAEEAGEAAAEGEGPDCADLFPSCPFGSGILDHVTQVGDTWWAFPASLPLHWTSFARPGPVVAAEEERD